VFSFYWLIVLDTSTYRELYMLTDRAASEIAEITLWLRVLPFFEGRVDVRKTL
jgi:hypothetical protein